MGIDEEHEALQTHRYIHQLHALRFGIGFLLCRGRGTEENVRIPVDNGFVAADSIFVLHGAVRCEILAVEIIIGEAAADIGHAAGRIHIVDDGGIYRNQRRCAVQHRKVAGKAEGSVDVGEVRACLVRQERTYIHHFGLGSRAEIVGESSGQKYIEAAIEGSKGQYHRQQDRDLLFHITTAPLR